MYEVLCHSHWKHRQLANVHAPNNIVIVAEKVGHRWKRLVLILTAEFFMNKTRSIEMENRDDCFMQVVTELNMWTDQFGNTANHATMIRAMCAIGCRSLAEDVFSCRLVELVCQH